MKESFLPFWVTTAAVEVVLRGAQVGFDAWVSVYNPQTRRYEQQLQTTWRQARLHQTWQRSYSATEEGMQVTPLLLNKYITMETWVVNPLLPWQLLHSCCAKPQATRVVVPAVFRDDMRFGMTPHRTCCNTSADLTS